MIHYFRMSHCCFMFGMSSSPRILVALLLLLILLLLILSEMAVAVGVALVLVALVVAAVLAGGIIMVLDPPYPRYVGWGLGWE